MAAINARGVFVLASLLVVAGLTGGFGRAADQMARVYVTAYPSCRNSNGTDARDPREPVIALYNRANYGDADAPALMPAIRMQPASSPFIEFYFDAPAGNYDAFLRFSKIGKDPDTCGRNGPLVLLAGRTRSLFVGGSSVTDWHSPAAIAGKVPIKGLRIQLLMYDHAMHCGDEIHMHDPNTFKEIGPPHISRAVLDDGAYYANFHAYGPQDHTLALQISGGLFTEGAILLTSTPKTAPGKPPFIIKDITPEVVQAAMIDIDRLACVKGF